MIHFRIVGITARVLGSRSLRDEPDETSPSKMQRVVPQMDPGAGDEMDVDPYFGNPTRFDPELLP